MESILNCKILSQSEELKYIEGRQKWQKFLEFQDETQVVNLSILSKCGITIFVSNSFSQSKVPIQQISGVAKGDNKRVQCYSDDNIIQSNKELLKQQHQLENF